jgi:hypothetical protein
MQGITMFGIPVWTASCFGINPEEADSWTSKFLQQQREGEVDHQLALGSLKGGFHTHNALPPRVDLN